MLSIKMIKEAYLNISKYVIKTDIKESVEFNNILYKLENEQILNCAKIRGAFNSLLKYMNEKKEIVTVSSGNHGLSIAYVSNLLNMNNVTIFIPKTISKNKLDKIKSFNVNFVQSGKDYDGAYLAALEYIKDKDAIFIDPCSDKYALAGQGTIAIEILEQINDIDQIFIPLGGGGIITGNALYLKKYAPHIKVIGVSTEKSPAMLKSLKEKKRYKSYDCDDSICEALIGGVGEIPYKLASKVIDEIFLVNEKYIYDAMKHLKEKENIIVEPSAAISLALFFQNPKIFENKRNLLVLTGANFDRKEK